MIKAVFFDIDDTLLSFSGYVKETMQKGFALFGLPLYREPMFSVFERINGDLWRRIEERTLTFEELINIRWNLIFRELNISLDGKIFEEYFRKQLFDSAILEPGVAEILDYLKGKYVLCVASNGPYAQQIHRLRVGKLYDSFRHFFISEKIGVSKPNAAFFDFCFKKLHESGLPDLLPEEVIMIGDSASSDIAGGKTYGLKTCFYHKKADRNRDRTDFADYEIADLSDIKKIL